MDDILHSSPELHALLPQGGSGPFIVADFSVTLGQEAQPIGALRLRTTGQTACSAFRYHPSWFKRRAPFMISPELRHTLSSQWTTSRTGVSRNVFAALADTAPEGVGLSVVQRAETRGLLELFRSPEQEPSPWDALCMVPDVARRGALRLSPAYDAPLDSWQASLLLPRTSDLGAMAAAVRDFERSQEDLRQLLLLLYCATALPGSRPKCTFIQDDGQLTVATFPSSADSYPVTRLQVLVTKIAKIVGIDVLDQRLLHPVTHPIVLAPRFDRSPSGQRAPFLSAQSLLLAKANDPVGHMELLEAMRVSCKDFVSDARQLWCRLVFNHLLNHDGLYLRKLGFLYAGRGLWRLAPACGLLPQLEQTRNSARRPTHGLRLDTSLDGLLEDAEAFEVKRADAIPMVRRQLLALLDWKSLAKLFAINVSDIDLARLEPVMDNPQLKFARQCLKV